jgi:hypothetical protein
LDSFLIFKKKFKNFKTCSGKCIHIDLLCLAYLLFEGIFTLFSWRKSHEEFITQQKLRFLNFFCLMMEGSGSGSVPLTNGSGSVRPKKFKDPPGFGTLLMGPQISSKNKGIGDTLTVDPILDPPNLRPKGFVSTF